MNACIEFLNQTGEIWWDHTFSMAWQVAAVFLIVAVLSLLFRKLPAAYRYGLWLLLLVKLLLPPSLAVITGLGYWLRPPDVIAPAPVAVSAAVDPIPNVEYSPALPPVEPVVVSWLTPPISLTWQGGLFVVWLAAALALLVLIGWRTHRFHIAVRSGHEPDDPGIIAAWERCKKKMGTTRRVRLVESEGVDSPVVVGIFRPVVVLPGGLAGRGGDVEPVLLHELAHVRRRDVPVNWLQVLLQVAYWYHPCVWLANRMIRRERERACDDLVLTHLRVDPREYASSLLEIARRGVGSSWLTAGFLGMAEPGGDVGGRIRRILDAGRKIAPGLTRWVLVAVLALGATVLPWGKRQIIADEKPGVAVSPSHSGAMEDPADVPPENSPASGSPNIRAKEPGRAMTPEEDALWKSRLDFLVGNLDFGEPVDLGTLLTNIVGKLSGFEFLIDDHVSGEVDINDSSGKTLREVLDMILEPKGYTWERIGDTIVVSVNKASENVESDFLIEIRALVAELPPEKAEELGIGAPDQDGRFLGLSAEPLSATRAASLIDDLTRSAGTDPDMNILANPTILARNHQSAMVYIGERIPDGQNPGEFIDTGTILSATPVIEPDGNTVDMDFELVVRELVKFISTKDESGSEITVPVIDESTIRSRVKIKSGEALVLGGFAGDHTSTSKDPETGEKIVEAESEHLVMLLRAEILPPGTDGRNDTSALDSR
jgi:beta-lactamase regulating signal transducer with metallopeptidase domain